ncbi:hypothetical protein V6N13_137009 [Hibiscus sabdariffa]|uniref:F-box domain-containing protein n=1 Tax=Hibiscus sabdariffa TaxID=183260 RepID=A0ABR2DLX5_9ROSI
MQEHDGDRISELPEELLVRILCSLSLKEAARTSAVSRIWRDLWKFVTGSLNFEPSQTLLASPEELQKERDGCVEWIARVLNSHKAPTIDELRICFDFTQQHSDNIHRWIQIALMKRVKRIELDFRPRSKLVGWWSCGDYMFAPQFCGSPEIKFLTSLCFKHVNISGQVLEAFLSGCPLLETLHVSDLESQELTNLNICGSSLRLKHLHISFWRGVKRIEVYAPNLVSFEYNGEKNRALRIHLKYVPQLLDVSYGVPYGVPWDSMKGDVNFCQAFPSCLSTCVSQLVNLSLQFDAYISIRGCPKLPNLQYLTCKVRDLYLLSKGGLLNLLTLVDSSPLLHKFKVVLQKGNAIRMKKGSEAVRKLIEEVETMIIKDGERHEMQGLREVEIVGFVGAKPDAALLVYLANTALNLGNIVINTCPPNRDNATLVYKQRIEKPEEARELACDLLLDYLPEGAKFLVL